MLRKITKSLLGDKILGKLDYYRFPEQKKSWGGPFNGQLFRKEIFTELIAKISFDCVVETGTFKGTTTEYMAQTIDFPIFTVEAMERNYGYAAHRLREFENIFLQHGDSRSFIKQLASQPELLHKTVMFYLDAHWYDDLPLAEELGLIFKYWDKMVILIDDFQVPDDPGYGYDDYGVGKALTLDYLKVHDSYEFRVFVPTLPSDQETGARRGMVVLANNRVLIEILQQLKTLREYRYPV